MDEIARDLLRARKNISKEHETFNVKDRNQILLNSIEQNALNFIRTRSDESLKEWLSSQPIPYDAWKNATHNELVALVLVSYDEQ